MFRDSPVVGRPVIQGDLTVSGSTQRGSRTYRCSVVSESSLFDDSYTVYPFPYHQATSPCPAAARSKVLYGGSWSLDVELPLSGLLFFEQRFFLLNSMDNPENKT